MGIENAYEIYDNDEHKLPSLVFPKSDEEFLLVNDVVILVENG